MDMFASEASFSTAEAGWFVKAIRQLEPELARRADSLSIDDLAYCLGLELGRAPVDGRVLVGKEVALNFAAEAIGCADTLHLQGRCATAFALEGIAGRLIEALIVTEAPGGATCGQARAVARPALAPEYPASSPPPGPSARYGSGAAVESPA